MKSLADYIPATSLIADLFERARIPLPAQLVLDVLEQRYNRRIHQTAIARMAQYRNAQVVPALDTAGRRCRGWYVHASVKGESGVVPAQVELAYARAKAAVLGTPLPPLPPALPPGDRGE